MSNPNDCRNRREALVALVLGELDAQAADELTRHIESCRNCRMFYDALAEEEKTVRSAFRAMDTRSKSVGDALVAQWNTSGRKSVSGPVILDVIKGHSQGVKTIAKLAAAALIIVAVVATFTVLRTFNVSLETPTWASISETFARVQNVHFTFYATGSDEQKRALSEVWIRRPACMRMEGEGTVCIDNGTDRLTFDRNRRTAQFEDSYQDFNPVVEDVFTFVALAAGQGWPTDTESGQERHFDKPTLTELPAESTGKALVFEGRYPPQKGVKREPSSRFKVWIDPQTLLIQRLAYKTEDSRNELQEIIFDYYNIPDTKFSLTVPADYTTLPRKTRIAFSGRVLDERGVGVSGATVCIGAWPSHLTGRTNAEGEFEIKAKPFTESVRFPILVRAFDANESERSAWTLVADPQDEGQLEGTIPPSGDVRLAVNDQMGTRACTGVEGITISMEPALLIVGVVTDTMGNPVEGARVSIETLGWKYSDGRPWMGPKPTLVGADGSPSPSTTTDSGGRYLFTGLPRFWKGFSLGLRVEAPGYSPTSGNLEVGESLQISESLLEEKDFQLFKSVTVKGRVINNEGEPLVGYYVGYAVSNGDGYSMSARTDRDGLFELSDCPPSADLKIRVAGSLKPPDWGQKWGEVPDSVGKEFVYYLDKTQPVAFSPERSEYDVQIVLNVPDRIVDFEVKDTAGRPIEGLEVRLRNVSMGAQWVSQLKATTDSQGWCTLSSLPRIGEMDLSVQWHFIGEPQSDEETQDRQRLRQYKGLVQHIEFPGDAKHYWINIVIPKEDDQQQATANVRLVED